MKYLFPILSISVVVLLFSCSPDEDFYTASDAMIEVSADTLRFDTVFTELGSATRILKLYNPYNQSINISRISIEGGSNTPFRLNIDGTPGNEITDVEIRPSDSLYIFGEVTIDPDQPISASPFVIEDNIVIETNGNTQKVLLEAWGQNANYIPSRFGKGGQALLTCDMGEEVWDDPKPYVIYGILLVDECTLKIPAGTQIYVHGGLVQNEDIGVYSDGYLYILENGTLHIEGTLEEPVVIQGDRLEEPFQEVAAQWVGVVLDKGSTGNEINHTIIKNSRFGIFVDSTAELTARNSQFYNNAGFGMRGFHSTINAENCLFYNNFANSLQLILGGDYDFKYCTFASYGVDASALFMSNFWCYDAPNCQIAAEFPLDATFTNCIIAGSRADEIVLNDAQANAAFNYKFENCIIREDELTDLEAYTNFYDFCSPCINITTQDTLFADANDDDYHLDTLSVAEMMAIPISGIELDLDGKVRDANMPDIGCYEYQYE